jgi:hypothetical protein
MAKAKDLGGKNGLLGVGGTGGLGASISGNLPANLNLNPGKPTTLGGAKSFGSGGVPHQIKAHGNVKGGGVDKSAVSRRPKV